MKKIILLTSMLFFMLVGIAFAETIITATLDAKTKDVNITKGMVPITFYITGTIAGAEAITVKHKKTDGTYQDAKENSASVVLNENNSMLSVYSPIQLQFSKSTTALAVGLIQIQ